jgi:hypothetical protein
MDTVDISGVGEMQYVLQELRGLWEKSEQVHRIYSTLWNERADMYTIILQRTATEIEHGIAADLSRLEIINQREQRVLTTLNKSRAATADLVNRLGYSLKRIAVNRATAFELRDRDDLERMLRIIEQYHEEIMHVQQTFLLVELTFIRAPSMDTLRATYCRMLFVHERVSAFTQQYQSATSGYRHITDVQSSVKRLMTSMDDECRRDGKFARIKDKLRPYFDNTNALADGTSSQRFAHLSTNTIPSIVRMIVGMGIVTPLVFESAKLALGGVPSLRTAVPGLPQFGVDWCVLVLSLVGMYLDVMLKLSHRATEGVDRMLKSLRSRGSTNPQGFSCPELSFIPR